MVSSDILQYHLNLLTNIHQRFNYQTIAWGLLCVRCQTDSVLFRKWQSFNSVVPRFWTSFSGQVPSVMKAPKGNLLFLLIVWCCHGEEIKRSQWKYVHRILGIYLWESNLLLTQCGNNILIFSDRLTKVHVYLLLSLSLIMVTFYTCRSATLWHISPLLLSYSIQKWKTYARAVNEVKFLGLLTVIWIWERVDDMWLCRNLHQFTIFFKTCHRNH